MKHTAHRLSSEIRRHQRETYSKWFAYGIAGFTVCWFTAHFIMGAH